MKSSRAVLEELNQARNNLMAFHAEGKNLVRSWKKSHAAYKLAFQELKRAQRKFNKAKTDYEKAANAYRGHNDSDLDAKVRDLYAEYRAVVSRGEE